MSEGALSESFPEVSVTITSSFAHDRGMVSSISALRVGGEPCAPTEVLQKLVALRGGWTRSGGRSDADALQTFERFVSDWAALFEWSGRQQSETAPPHMGRFVGFEATGIGEPLREAPAYHPPRIGLYTLEDGQTVVYHAYFHSWDGGNHGRLYDYRVEAYRVRDGAPAEVDRLAVHRAP